MREWVFVSLVLSSLIGCGGSSPAPQQASPPSAAATTSAPTPPPEPAADFEPTDDARAALATTFITAVARRDDAALATLLPGRDFCEHLATLAPADLPPEKIDDCTAEVSASNDEALAEYRAAVAESFEIGTVEVKALDADKGFYQVIVTARGGDAMTAVWMMEVNGRRFILFPQRKG